MTRFHDRFYRAGRPADTVQMAVYVWQALTAVGAFFLTYLKVAASRSRLEAGLYASVILIGGLLLALAPVVFRRGPRIAAQRSLNDALQQREFLVEMKVEPQGAQFRTRATLAAIERTNRVMMSSTPTGTCKLKRTVASAGLLKGPAEDLDRLVWELTLPEQLEPEDVYYLDETLTVDDPDQTMKPFYSVGTRGYRVYGVGAMRVTFVGWRPSLITRRIEGAPGYEQNSSPPENVYLDAQGSAEWKIGPMVRGTRYVLNWSAPPKRPSTHA